MKASNPAAKPSATRSPLSDKVNQDSQKWDCKDSSEDIPSSHDSLFDAIFVSQSEAALLKLPDLKPIPSPHKPIIDLRAESPLTLLEENPFIYGQGTELAPILEQRSYATLRAGASRSTSDLSSLLKHPPSIESQANSTTPLRRVSRQQSFSLDDLSPIQSNQYRYSLLEPPTSSPRTSSRWSIERERSPLQTPDLQAYPKHPSYPPPNPVPTPPNFARIARRQLPDSHLFRMTSGRANTEAWRPNFRGIRSGHGNLAQHPFIRGRHSLTGRNPTGRRRRGMTREPGACFEDTPAAQQSDMYQSGRAQVRVCRTCRRPVNERWSMWNSILGTGEGARVGEEWCCRCAMRKTLWSCSAFFCGLSPGL